MQVKSVYEKRVAILRAVMIVARANHFGPALAVSEDNRAYKILLACFEVTLEQVQAFFRLIIRNEWSVGYIARFEMSEVPHV